MSDIQTPPAVVESSASAVSADDKTNGMVAHLLVLLTGWVGALIWWLVKKDNATPFVLAHAKEALNFGISIQIYVLICMPLLLVIVGILLLPIICIFAIVMAIIACIAANKGEAYRYPLTIRLIK